MIRFYDLDGHLIEVGEDMKMVIKRFLASGMSIEEVSAKMDASMEDLPFQKNSLDLIWSEGAIDNIDFEKGISHWHDFLKKEGFIAVTCPSWLTKERPAIVEQFWYEAGSRLDCERTILFPAKRQLTGY